MEQLIIEASDATPYINFDPSTGVLKISGESFPENAAKFYSPIVEWSHEYLKNPAVETRLIFEVVYFNSSTSKVFMTILDLFDDAAAEGLNACVIWKCDEDNDIGIEAGEDFQEDLHTLTFEIVTDEE